MPGLDNFDFLLGKWTVANRRLRERLCQCDEWEEFTATMETKPILHGLGVMDEMKTDYFGQPFIGLSIRLYNPAAQEWTIYWADTAHPTAQLKEQVVGKFAQGKGEFLGQERFQGEMVQLRFIWKEVGPLTYQWEQAYLDPQIQAWETNWTMVFSPLKE